MHIYIFLFTMLGMIKNGFLYTENIFLKPIPTAGETITRILWTSIVMLQAEILLRLY